MAFSQEMAYSESGHIGSQSTLFGLQSHEKINVGSAKMDSPGVSL